MCSKHYYTFLPQRFMSHPASQTPTKNLEGHHDPGCPSNDREASNSNPTMTIRERAPEKSSRAHHVLPTSDTSTKRPRLTRNGSRQRRFLVSTAFFGLALAAWSLTRGSTSIADDLRDRTDMDRPNAFNSTNRGIVSPVEFEKQMAGFNQANIEAMSPHEVDCENIHLDPNDPGEMRETSIDPSFLINIHDPKTDIAVSQEIIDWGCFECDVMRPLAKALRDHPDASLVDIGGNIGQYSLQAAAMNRNAYAFEPFHRNYMRFCHSIKANPGFKDRIKLFNSAVMHEATEVKLQAAWRNQGGTRVVSYGKRETGAVKTGTAYAHGVTLDDMSEYLPRGRVVLKLDVEGAECKALAGGLDKYLKQLDIIYVAIEWSYERLQECERRNEIFQLFQENGLTPYLHQGNREWHRKHPSTALIDWRNTHSLGTDLFDMAWTRSNPGE